MPGTVLAQASSPPPTETIPPSTTSSPVAPDLPSELRAGEAWEVAAFDPWGEGLIGPRADTRLTVTLLDAGRLEGETGCGTYFGVYSVEGDQIALTVVTKGPDPCSVAVNEEAVAFSVALEAVTRWQPADGGLQLLDAGGDVRLDLRRGEDSGVVGEWLADRYWPPNGRPIEPMPQRPIEIRFAPDGSISGSNGCRLLEGFYQAETDQVIIAVDTVGLPCEGEVLRQERRLLRAIDAVVLWQREGDRLLLTDGFGEPLLELRAATTAGSGSRAEPDA